MRAFLILSFIAVTCAAPQYNYQPSASLDPGNLLSPGYAPSNNGLINGPLSGGNLLDSGVNNGGLLTPGGSPNGDSLATAGYNKHYFYHDAPEDEFNDNEANEKIATSLKKNLQVVFIKSPENKGLENAALQLAKQAGEDKTAIYVLNKQTDISELAERLQQLKENNPNKPEVHFVKYKTPEEAENAKQQIQAQYDNLPGPSRVSNEGIAPVLNFIRSQASKPSFPSHSNGNNPSSGPYSSYIPPPRQTYLPIRY